MNEQEAVAYLQGLGYTVYKTNYPFSTGVSSLLSYTGDFQTVFIPQFSILTDELDEQEKSFIEMRFTLGGGCVDKKYCINCKKWFYDSICLCALWQCPDCSGSLRYTQPKEVV
jgi:hypothetical protein